MTSVSITPKGPFSLAASRRFLEDFTPASYDHAADGVLRLAFPADDGVHVIGCAVRQKETAGPTPAAVTADITVHHGDTTLPAGSGTAHHRAARAQLARILSLDVDGTGFPALADADPVVAGLQADWPGLRPVCFHSPYEAAVWAVIGNRIRMSQAAAIKARLARDHGQAVQVAGEELHAFPAPGVLRRLDRVEGLSDTKLERLRALSEAALDGSLDAATLRDQPVESALTELQGLPGIGPFSAGLVLVRGAGHPDVFPTVEPRLHRAMATQYGLDAATAGDPARLARLATAWRPYRSWVALLLRARAQDSASR